MKNKEKYNLEYISVKPKYMVDGCGKKIMSSFKFDIYYRDELIEKDVKARDNLLPYLMKWMEKDIISNKLTKKA